MALSLMMHWQLSGKLLLEVCTWVLLPTVVHDSDTTASFEKGGGRPGKSLVMSLLRFG